MNRLMAMAVAAVAAAAQAQDVAPMDAERAERCAVRLAVSLTGRSPAAALVTSATPQAAVDELVASADFVERFSRFVNATFNAEPGATSAEDAAYHLTRHVLLNDKPWKDVFVGPYTVAVVNNAAVVQDDANGLGYFRSRAWLLRYAGNEEQGIKLSTAYRMMNNAVGLRLTANVNVAGTDTSLDGRQGSGCRTCHFDGWYALDKVASVLTRVNRSGTTVTFTPPVITAPVDILGGKQIRNDKELMTALVESEAFEFRACRLAFEFLYGRKELACEGPVFDRCMDAYRASGKIQAAVAAVARDSSYCQ